MVGVLCSKESQVTVTELLGYPVPRNHSGRGAVLLGISSWGTLHLIHHNAKGSLCPADHSSRGTLCLALVHQSARDSLCVARGQF